MDIINKVFLSDLVLKGIPYRPQTDGIYFKLTKVGVCACAMGSAMEGAAGEYQGTEEYDARAYDMLIDAIGYDPQLQIAPETLAWRLNLRPGCMVFDVVTYMNDNLGKTREEIAVILKEHGL